MYKQLYEFLVVLWHDESGGYGGIFKSIVKIAFSFAGNFICGPPCAAIGSALGTVITGGSFTEALISGATTFIGASIGSAITGGLSGAELIGPPVAGAGFAGGVTDFLTTTGNSLLGDIGLSASFLAANAGVIGAGVGGVISLTLNEALTMDIPGLNEELEQTFGPEEAQFLQQQARDAQLEGIFQELVDPASGLVGENPFFKEGFAEDEQIAAAKEFQTAIAQGLRRQDQSLGLNVTQSQFDEVFRNPNLSANILGEERGIRQEGFTGELGGIFTGDAFGEIDDDIINSIIEERRGPAQQQVSNFDARGNLNPLGGQTANDFLLGQVEPAGERLREIGGGVQQANQAAINDVRDRATQGIGAFQLGDDLFDVSPFGLERSNLISERGESLRSDILSSLGSEPLFDVTGALQTAGRTQGVVSGTPNVSFLDAIAAREAGATSKTKRGLGSRGSGAF